MNHLLFMALFAGALPAEAHDYRAREAVGYALYETADWLDSYVKNRK